MLVVLLCSPSSYKIDACWRLVEAQNQLSTRKLVSDLEEYDLLEHELEATKPPIPKECIGLDFLLFSPFRYEPYPKASRFRDTGISPGVYYAAEDPITAVYEMVFYSLKTFSAAPDAGLPSVLLEKSAITVGIETASHLDLTTPPYVEHSEGWTNPKDYSACIGLAHVAVKNNVGVIRYESVRDPNKRANLAIFDPLAFCSKTPKQEGTWRVYFDRKKVTLICENPKKKFDIDIKHFYGDEDIKNFFEEKYPEDPIEGNQTVEA